MSFCEDDDFLNRNILFRKVTELLPSFSNVKNEKEKEGSERRRTVKRLNDVSSGITNKNSFNQYQFDTVNQSFLPSKYCEGISFPAHDHLINLNLSVLPWAI